MATTLIDDGNALQMWSDSSVRVCNRKIIKNKGGSHMNRYSKISNPNDDDGTSLDLTTTKEPARQAYAAGTRNGFQFSFCE